MFLIARASRRGRAARVAVGALVAAQLLCSPPAGAATTVELEARVQALSAQLQALQAEIEALQACAGATAPTAPTAPARAPTPVAATADAAPAVVAPGPTFFGYGELNYLRPRDDSAATTADVGRFVFGMAYAFDARTRFVGELELEHAVSSGDDPGEVEVEQAYVERELGRDVFGRAGLILIPSGTLNESHEPPRYYGVFRNFVESAIIPTTWREGGIALQGSTLGGLRWDVGMTTGFDLSKWDATSTEGRESPLGAIHQELALARARDLSYFGALNYTGLPGLGVGGSVFTGGASQGQPGIPSAAVTLWEGHLRWTPASWDLAALYARGHIGSTRVINRTLVGNPTLVPERFFGGYVQAAFRAVDNGRWSLAPFLRYERFNTAAVFADLGTGLTPAAAPDTRVWTTGLNLMLAPGVVVKADYLDFDGGDGGDRFDLGVGYQF